MAKKPSLFIDPSRVMIFDIEAGGLWGSQSSIMSIASQEMGAQSPVERYAAPVPGTTLSQFSVGIWDRIKQRQAFLAGSKISTEKAIISDFIASLEKLHEGGPGATLAGWNIGYTYTQQSKGVRGYDIPMLVTRAKEYNLDDRLKRALRKVEIRDLGAEMQVFLARTINQPQHRALVREEFLRSAQGLSKLIHIQGLDLADIRTQARHISSGGFKVAGWKQKTIYEALFQEQYPAHMAHEDIQAISRITDRITQRMSPAEEKAFIIRWNRLATVQRFVSSAREAGNFLKDIKKEVATLGLAKEFDTELSAMLKETGGKLEDLVQGRGLIEKKFVVEGGHKIFARGTSSSFIKTASRFIRNNKIGVAIGLGAAATLAIGPLSLFSGHDDAYNTIEGLSHKGIAGQNRRINTDFGSGFQRFENAQRLWDSYHRKERPPSTPGITRAHVRGESYRTTPSGRIARYRPTFVRSYETPVRRKQEEREAKRRGVFIAKRREKERHNTIPGLQDRGIAPSLRHTLTDFGSGYQGSGGIPSTLMGVTIDPRITEFRRDVIDDRDAKIRMLEDLRAKEKAAQAKLGALDEADFFEHNLRTIFGINERELTLKSIRLNRFTINVEDADTLVLQRKGLINRIKSLVGYGDVSVRLAGIDAPEVAGHAGDPLKDIRIFQEQVGGKEATWALKRLIEKNQDDLSILVSTGQKTYGRYLGVLGGQEGTNLNIELIRSGAVMALPFGEESKDIVSRRAAAEAEAQARREQEGLWKYKRYQAINLATQNIGRDITFNTFTRLDKLASNLNLGAYASFLEQLGATEGSLSYREMAIARRMGRVLAKTHGPDSDKSPYQRIPRNNLPYAQKDGFWHVGLASKSRPDYGFGSRSIRWGGNYLQRLYPGVYKVRDKTIRDKLLLSHDGTTWSFPELLQESKILSPKKQAEIQRFIRNEQGLGLKRIALIRNDLHEDEARTAAHEFFHVHISDSELTTLAKASKVVAETFKLPASSDWYQRPSHILEELAAYRVGKTDIRTLDEVDRLPEQYINRLIPYLEKLQQNVLSRAENIKEPLRHSRIFNARISGRDDAYNTIEGMPHGWFGNQRKYNTDFGSGRQKVLSASKSIADRVISSGSSSVSKTVSDTSKTILDDTFIRSHSSLSKKVLRGPRTGADRPAARQDVSRSIYFDPENSSNVSNIRSASTIIRDRSSDRVRAATDKIVRTLEGEEWVIGSELGHGGMGVVFDAHHIASGRRAVYKTSRYDYDLFPEDYRGIGVIPRAVGQRSSSITDRVEIALRKVTKALIEESRPYPSGHKDIFREALLQKRAHELRSDIVPEVYGITSEGGFLQEKLASEVPVSEYGRVRKFLRKNLPDLAKKGVMHLDPSVTNVMKTASGEYKLTDFGVAVPTEKVSSSREVTQLFRGMSWKGITPDELKRYNTYLLQREKHERVLAAARAAAEARQSIASERPVIEGEVFFQRREPVNQRFVRVPIPSIGGAYGESNVLHPGSGSKASADNIPDSFVPHKSRWIKEAIKRGINTNKIASAASTLWKYNQQLDRKLPLWAKGIDIQTRLSYFKSGNAVKRRQLTRIKKVSADRDATGIFGPPVDTDFPVSSVGDILSSDRGETFVIRKVLSREGGVADVFQAKSIVTGKSVAYKERKLSGSLESHDSGKGFKPRAISLDPDDMSAIERIIGQTNPIYKVMTQVAEKYTPQSRDILYEAAIQKYVHSKSPKHALEVFGTTSRGFFQELARPLLSSKSSSQLTAAELPLAAKEAKMASQYLQSSIQEVAESTGVMHLDPSTDNLLMDFRGNFKISDWGLAIRNTSINKFNPAINEPTREFFESTLATAHFKASRRAERLVERNMAEGKNQLGLSSIRSEEIRNVLDHNKWQQVHTIAVQQPAINGAKGSRGHVYQAGKKKPYDIK